MIVLSMCLLGMVFLNTRFLLGVHTVWISASVWNIVVFEIIFLSLVFQCQWLMELILPHWISTVPIFWCFWLIIIAVRVDCYHLRFWYRLSLNIIMMMEWATKVWVVEVLDIIFISLVLWDQWLIKLIALLRVGIWSLSDWYDSTMWGQLGWSSTIV